MLNTFDRCIMFLRKVNTTTPVVRIADSLFLVVALALIIPIQPPILLADCATDEGDRGCGPVSGSGSGSGEGSGAGNFVEVPTNPVDDPVQDVFDSVPNDTPSGIEPELDQSPGDTQGSEDTVQDQTQPGGGLGDSSEGPSEAPTDSPGLLAGPGTDPFTEGEGLNLALDGLNQSLDAEVIPPVAITDLPPFLLEPTGVDTPGLTAAPTPVSELSAPSPSLLPSSLSPDIQTPPLDTPIPSVPQDVCNECLLRWQQTMPASDSRTSEHAYLAYLTEETNSRKVRGLAKCLLAQGEQLSQPITPPDLVNLIRSGRLQDLIKESCIPKQLPDPNSTRTSGAGGVHVSENRSFSTARAATEASL